MSILFFHLSPISPHSMKTTGSLRSNLSYKNVQMNYNIVKICTAVSKKERKRMSIFIQITRVQSYNLLIPQKKRLTLK